MSVLSNAISDYKMTLTQAAEQNQLMSAIKSLTSGLPLPHDNSVLQGRVSLLSELNRSGSKLIGIKTRMEVVNALHRKPSPYKRIQELENQLKEKENAEQRTIKAETELSKTEERLAALDKMFTNLSAKVKKDFGQRYRGVNSDRFHDHRVRC